MPDIADSSRDNRPHRCPDSRGDHHAIYPANQFSDLADTPFDRSFAAAVRPAMPDGDWLLPLAIKTLLSADAELSLGIDTDRHPYHWRIADTGHESRGVDVVIANMDGVRFSPVA